MSSTRPGRSKRLPETMSVKTRMAPASMSRARWASRFWSLVETRAYRAAQPLAGASEAQRGLKPQLIGGFAAVTALTGRDRDRPARVARCEGHATALARLRTGPVAGDVPMCTFPAAALPLLAVFVALAMPPLNENTRTVCRGDKRR